MRNMKKIKKILTLVFLWGIPVILICILPWIEHIGQQFNNQITFLAYILTILFWICIAISATTRNWWLAICSIVTACLLLITRIIT